MPKLRNGVKSSPRRGLPKVKSKNMSCPCCSFIEQSDGSCPDGDAYGSGCCGPCGCDCIPNSGTTEDCAGACGGSAELDECGVCNGPGPPCNDNGGPGKFSCQPGDLNYPACMKRPPNETRRTGGFPSSFVKKSPPFRPEKKRKLGNVRSNRRSGYQMNPLGPNGEHLSNWKPRMYKKNRKLQGGGEKGSRRRPLPYGPQKPPLSVVSDPYEDSPNQRPGSDIPFVQGWNYVWVDNLPPSVSLGMLFSTDGTCEGLPNGLTLYADYMPEGVTGGVCKTDRCDWPTGSCQHFFNPSLWTWWGHTDCWPLTTCEAEFECCTSIDCTCTCGNWQTGGGQTGPVLILANYPGGEPILLAGPYAGYIQRITSNLYDPCGFQDWARDGWYDW